MLNDVYGFWAMLHISATQTAHLVRPHQSTYYHYHQRRLHDGTAVPVHH